MADTKFWKKLFIKRKLQKIGKNIYLQRWKLLFYFSFCKIHWEKRGKRTLWDGIIVLKDCKGHGCLITNANFLRFLFIRHNWMWPGGPLICAACFAKSRHETDTFASNIDNEQNTPRPRSKIATSCEKGPDMNFIKTRRQHRIRPGPSSRQLVA